MLSLFLLTAAQADSFTVSAADLSYDSKQDAVVVRLADGSRPDSGHSVIWISDAESSELSFSLLVGASTHDDGTLRLDASGDLFVGSGEDSVPAVLATTGVGEGVSGVRLSTDSASAVATNGSALFAARGVTDWGSTTAGWLVTDEDGLPSLWVDDPLTGDTIHIGEGHDFDIGEDCWYRLAADGETWYRYDIGEDCWHRLTEKGWELVDADTDEVWAKMDIGEDCWYRYDIGEDCWYRFDIGEDCWHRLSAKGWEKADIGEDCWLTAGKGTAQQVTLTPLEGSHLKEL